MGLRPFSGALEVEGRAMRFRDAAQAFAAGVAYVSEDRKGRGLLLGQSLRANLTLAALDRFTHGPIIDVGDGVLCVKTPLGERLIATPP